MGTWSTAISDDDTFCEIYERFFELYDAGLGVEEITEKVASEFQEIRGLREAVNNYWFAIARAQWECKSLDETVFATVKTIVETESDITIWMELGATDDDITKRRRVLRRFLQSLARPKARIRPRRKRRKSVPAVYDTGDCIVFKKEDGMYGGAFVLATQGIGRDGFNCVVNTTIVSINKPILNDFISAFAPIVQKEVFESGIGYRPKNIVDLRWYPVGDFAKNKGLFERIGNLSVERSYSTQDGFTGHLRWNSLIVASSDSDRRKVGQISLSQLRAKQ